MRISTSTNRTIWKELLFPVECQDIWVPCGAEILCAREQFGKVCVWFRCDPTQPKEQRSIAIVGTGYPAPADEGRYIDTVSLDGGSLIFHVFERAPERAPNRAQGW